MRNDGSGRLTRRRLWWSAVLVANLPIPILFGLGCVDRGGRVGMFAGIGFVWLIGHECCRRFPRVVWAVIPGGWLVAASQVWPGLQIVAGTIGLWAAALGVADRRAPHPRPESPLAGFTATIVTGGMLLAVAAVLGLIFRAIFPDEEWASDAQAGGPGKPKGGMDELA